MTTASRILRDFKKATGLSREELDATLRTSWESAWRHLEKTKRLSVPDVDITARIARLICIWEALEKPEPAAFVAFLKTPHATLGGLSPRDILDGFSVSEILKCIEMKKRTLRSSS